MGGSYTVKMLVKVCMMVILGVVGFILGKLISVLITTFMTAIYDKNRSFDDKNKPEKEAVRYEENSKNESD